MTAKAEQKSFATSAETREFERGTLDLLRIRGAEIGRLPLQPGWRWAEHVKPPPGPAAPPPSPGGTALGWPESSRWSWSTGTAQATTPGAELSGRRRRWPRP